MDRLLGLRTFREALYFWRKWYPTICFVGWTVRVAP
jgi:hypothetical protein